ncbi:MAG: hypothetical protein FJ317_03545 [SAR202 cluster bacterium]|nr:hypothetical protein [SAR202 cluster bacterium]
MRRLTSIAILASIAAVVAVCSQGAAATPSPTISALTSTQPVPTPDTFTPHPSVTVEPTAGSAQPTATTEPSGVVQPTSTPRPTATATPAPVPAFPKGIYYRLPDARDFVGTLAMVDGPRPRPIELFGVGFAINAEKVVLVDDNRVIIVTPDGRQRTVRADDLFRMARPTLSPDGTRIAVQATENPEQMPEDLNIYVINLADGAWERISFLPVNEESPEWFPNSNRIAYSSFDPSTGPETGVPIHIYDLDTGQEVRRITGFEGAGALSLSISCDEQTVLNPNLITLYDIATGELVADVRPAVRAALAAAGYEEDTRFAREGSRGSYTLDGTFTPDGRIVFDGAVKRGDDYGVIIASIAADGTGLEILHDLIPINPDFSNNNNFSQTNPYAMC